MSVEVVKRKKGKAYRVRYRDHANKPRTETFDRKADADARDATIRQAKQRNEPIPVLGHAGSRQTFEQFARDDWWPKDVVGRRLSAATREQYGNFLDVHLVPRIGDEPLAYIDVARVIDLRAQLATDNVPNYTAARSLKLLRQILGFAVNLGKIPHNPADVLRSRGSLPPQTRSTDIRPMPPEDTEALRRALLARKPHGLRDATLVSVLAYAGLRPGEALALTWEHVGKDSIRVEHANKDGNIGRTKTSERRTVPKLIKPLRDDLAKWRTASNPKASALVFPDDEDNPWTRWVYANWRARSFKPNAPDKARPYDLRHAYASLLGREGIDTAEIARRMGNSPTMTTQHYLHVFEGYRDKPNQPMEAVIKAARQRPVAQRPKAKRKAA